MEFSQKGQHTRTVLAIHHKTSATVKSPALIMWNHSASPGYSLLYHKGNCIREVDINEYRGDTCSRDSSVDRKDG